MVGCAVRTEKNMQAIDAWCAWRTLQTSPYMYPVILRHIRASLEEKWGIHTLIITAEVSYYYHL